MALIRLKRFEGFFHASGWLSVCSGLLLLFIMNINLLTDYEAALDHYFSLLLTVSGLSGVIALFMKRSRPLGLWGLGVSLFFILSIAVLFFLGWTIVLFP